VGAQLQRRFLRGSCNHFAVTADKGPCVIDGLAGMFLCVCIYICLYVYINIKSNMDMLLWARNFSDVLVRGSSNHYVVTANKEPCLVDGLAGLSLCVCICIL
jgi:hypothetical protein